MSSTEAILLTSGHDILKSEIWKYFHYVILMQNDICVLTKAGTTVRQVRHSPRARNLRGCPKLSNQDKYLNAIF